MSTSKRGDALQISRQDEEAMDAAVAAQRQQERANNDRTKGRKVIAGMSGPAH